MLKRIRKRFSKPVTLYEKCLKGKVGEVKKALERGEDPNGMGRCYRCNHSGHHPDCHDSQCNDGKTPLMAATIGNHPEVVALLLSQPEIEVNAKSIPFCQTALHFAVEKGSDAALSLLLAAPGLDPNGRDETGFARSTPMQDAVEYGNMNAMRLMASRAEVDLDVKNPQGKGLEELAYRHR